MASVTARGLAALALGMGLAGCGGDAASPADPGSPTVASVVVSPEATSVETGKTTRLTARVEDASGAPIQNPVITWLSSDPAKATVDGSGLVSGVAVGSVTVTATVEGKRGAASVTVNPPASGVVLTSISPSPLLEGQPATLTGSGFGLVPSNNKVTIDGYTAPVTASSATSIQILVPFTGCKPARTVDVQVRLLATPSNVILQPIHPAGVLTMSVGEQLMGRDPAGFCIQLPASPAAEAYLIGVQSTSELLTTLTPAVVASAVDPAAAPAAPLISASLQAPPSGPTPAISRLESSRLRQRTAEARLRAIDTRFLSGPGASLRAAGPTASGVSIPAGLQIGDQVPVRVPAIQGQCSTYTAITAVVRRITARSIWLEDLANPSGGFTAAHLQSLNNFFDASAYDTDVDYFGAPNDLDRNGRIAFVVTREVNRQSAAYDSLFNLAAFVRPVNNIATSACPSSNEGEIIYLHTPDPSGRVGYPTETADEDADLLLLLMAHEFVHVIQFGHAMPGNPAGTVVQPNWLIEAQATLAEEVVGHRVSGRAVGQNYGFSVAYNEPMTTPVDWYRAFGGLSYYFGRNTPTSRVPGAPEQCTWLGLEYEGNNGPCLGNDLIAYDVGWSFLRWLSDRYGPSLSLGEKAVHRALVDSRVKGFAAVSAAIGVPIDVLLAQWAAALYVDDRYPGMPAGLTFPSWNMFDIDQGKYATSRLTPRERGFGTFTDQVSVRAGSTAYFRVSGAGHGGTAIRVRDSSGGDLPAWMRVWIVRLQ